MRRWNPQPYFALMRLHQPAGIWLLFWPCLWSLTLASRTVAQEWPEARLIALFLIGSVAMRAAGCIVNDLWDRNIDRAVERTRLRPLASGALRPRQALALLALLLLVSLWVVWQLPPLCFGLALAALPLVAAYPAMKRITWWPQAFLGLTFNWGALMGWAAVTGSLAWPAWLLYAAGLCWTLGYDTIYAHQDAEDDALIGVKSTARLFGAASRRWVGAFYALCLFFLAAAAFAAEFPPASFALALLPAAWHFAWQLRRFDPSYAAACGRIFRSNIQAGALISLAFAAGWIKF